MKKFEVKRDSAHKLTVLSMDGGGAFKVFKIKNCTGVLADSHIENVAEYIDKISEINLVDFIKDVDSLSCALYFAGPRVVEEISEQCEGGDVRKAVDSAMYMLWHYYFKVAAIEGGFYDHFVKELLKIARKNIWYAARLGPILSEAHRTASEHGVTNESATDILDMLMKLNEELGFNIQEISDGVVKASLFEEKSCRSINASARYWQAKSNKLPMLKKRCLVYEDVGKEVM